MNRNCPVCHHDEYGYLYRPKSSPGDVVRCRACGLVYIADLQSIQSLIFDGPLLHGMDPGLLTSDNLADLPENHWEFSILHRKITEQPALDKNAVIALEKIKPYVQPGKILDFGCGWGFFLRVAQQGGWQCFGIEPLVGHALYARSKLSIPVVTDTLRDNSFESSFFDVITAFQVFEHLPDPDRVLQLLASFHKPNGILLLEVPNIDTWSVHLLRSRHRHFNPDHINFFSKKTMKLFLERHGYQVLEVFHPTRFMTVRYLLSFRLQNAFSSRFSNLFGKLANNRRISDIIVPMNMGDILGVIAIKTS